MNSVVSFLQDCRIGKKQVCRNLTYFPVLFPKIIAPFFLTLEQAIDSGVLVVTEVDASGNVKRLKLRNNLPPSDTGILRKVVGQILDINSSFRILNGASNGEKHVVYGTYTDHSRFCQLGYRTRSDKITESIPWPKETAYTVHL